MKHRVIILILALFPFRSVVAQNVFGTLEGTVRDGTTNKPLKGANVMIVGTDLGDAADSSGYFMIDGIPPGKVVLKITMIGYRDHRMEIEIVSGERRTLSIQLNSVVLKTTEITVEGARAEDLRLEMAPPTFTLQSQQIEQLPGGLDDVLSILQTLPGVLPLSDFSDQFIVRGGSPDQNLILLDGIELFNPYRRSGMAGLFNPAIVQNIKLYAGGFPALFGDRLSSVLVVTTREVTTGKRFSGRVSANTSTANIVFEGKTGFLNGGWLMSGRRSHFDRFGGWFARRLGIANEVAFPNFEDFQGKVVLRPAPGHRLQVHALLYRNIMDYLVKEELGEQDSDNSHLDGDDRTQNVVWGASWHYAPSTHFQARAYAHWYQNHGKSDFLANLTPVDEKDRTVTSLFGSRPPIFGTIDTIAFDYVQQYNFLKYSFGSWMVCTVNRHTVELGFGVDHLRNSITSELELNEFGKIVFDALISAPVWFGALNDRLDLKNAYSRWHAYVQDKWALLGEKIFVQPGIRYDFYGIIGEGRFSPRFSILFEMNPRTSIQMRWGIYRQSPGYEKLVDGGQIFDLVRFRSFEGLLEERAMHRIISLHRQLGDRWYLSTEGYTKKLENLIVQRSEQKNIFAGRYSHGIPAESDAYIIEERPVFQPTLTPANDATVSTYGIDLRLEKRAIAPSDHWYGWLSYAFGQARQQQSVRGTKKTFPFDYDRRHAFNLVLNYRFGMHWNLGITWQIGTGFPYTPALSAEPLVGIVRDVNDSTVTRGIVLTDPETGYVRFVPTFGGAENINCRRLPNYHRLDARITYATQWLNARLEFYIDLINVYNRKNVLYYRNIVRIEDEFENLPPALHFPKPVLYRQPVYMLPFIPSFGFTISF